MAIPKIYEDKKEKHLWDLPQKSDEPPKSIYLNLKNSSYSSKSTFSDSYTYSGSFISSVNYSYRRKMFGSRPGVSSPNYLETTTDTSSTNITSNNV